MIAVETTARNAGKTPGVFLFLLRLIVLSLPAMIIRFRTDHGKHNHDSSQTEYEHFHGIHLKECHFRHQL
jgi:hypothetical protein